jgi:hypothetical protein
MDVSDNPPALTITSLTKQLVEDSKQFRKDQANLNLIIVKYITQACGIMHESATKRGQFREIKLEEIEQTLESITRSPDKENMEEPMTIDEISRELFPMASSKSNSKQKFYKKTELDLVIGNTALLTTISKALRVERNKELSAEHLRSITEMLKKASAKDEQLLVLVEKFLSQALNDTMTKKTIMTAYMDVVQENRKTGTTKFNVTNMHAMRAKFLSTTGFQTFKELHDLFLETTSDSSGAALAIDSAQIGFIKVLLFQNVDKVHLTGSKTEPGPSGASNGSKSVQPKSKRSDPTETPDKSCEAGSKITNPVPQVTAQAKAIVPLVKDKASVTVHPIPESAKTETKRLKKVSLKTSKTDGELQNQEDGSKKQEERVVESGAAHEKDFNPPFDSYSSSREDRKRLEEWYENMLRTATLEECAHLAGGFRNFFVKHPRFLDVELNQIIPRLLEKSWTESANTYNKEAITDLDAKSNVAWLASSIDMTETWKKIFDRAGPNRIDKERQKEFPDQLIRSSFHRILSTSSIFFTDIPNIKGLETKEDQNTFMAWVNKKMRGCKSSSEGLPQKQDAIGEMFSYTVMFIQSKKPSACLHDMLEKIVKCYINTATTIANANHDDGGFPRESGYARFSKLDSDSLKFSIESWHASHFLQEKFRSVDTRVYGVQVITQKLESILEQGMSVELDGRGDSLLSTTETSKEISSVKDTKIMQAKTPENSSPHKKRRSTHTMSADAAEFWAGMAKNAEKIESWVKQESANPKSSRKRKSSD